MNILIIFSNLLFFIYWITRIHPIIKFLATFLLYLNTHNPKYLLYSIGDYLIEYNYIDSTLLCFMNGLIYDTTEYFYTQNYSLLFLIINNFIVYFCISDMLIYNYIIIHFIHYYYSKNKIKSICFISSDILIGLQIYKKININLDYLTYLLYWISIN